MFRIWLPCLFLLSILTPFNGVLEMSTPGGFPGSSMNGNADSLSTGRDPTKPCRACSDFKTWAKIQAQVTKNVSSQQKSLLSTTKKETHIYTRHDSNGSDNCPVDREELGRATWSFLHSMAAYYPDKPSNEEQQEMKTFFSIFAKYYPCDTCARDFTKELSKRPPEVQSQENFSKWLCDMHNAVNKKIGKPIFDCSRINERWRDGWGDGSCS